MRKDVKDLIDKCFIKGACLRGGYTSFHADGYETKVIHASTADFLHPEDEHFDDAVSEAVGRRFGNDASLYTDKSQKEIEDYIKIKFRDYKPTKHKKV